MATSVVNPRAQFFANNGRPLIGGRIHTFVAGSSTRATTYKDAAKAQPNTNPIVLDGRGEAQIYLAEGVEYKFVVEDSKGALIYTQEPVYGAIWPNAADWPSDATLAYKYMTEAKAAAEGTVLTYAPFDTYAQLQEALTSLPDGIAEVSRDETYGGARVRYRVNGGSAVFLVNLDQLRQDLDSEALGTAIIKVNKAVPSAPALNLQKWLDDEVVNVRTRFGVNPSATSRANTDNMQTAIDELKSKKSGGVLRLPFDAEPYMFAASSLDESYDNAGEAFNADWGAIVLRAGVSLIGDQGRFPKFKVDGGVASCFLAPSPDGNALRWLDIDGSWNPTIASSGHGIVQLNENVENQLCRNFTVAESVIHSVASYGVGVNNGNIENVNLYKLWIHDTGADGIDSKQRGSLQLNRGFFIDSILVERFGLRLGGATGIDLHGKGQISNVEVRDFGSADKDTTGIRCRTLSTPSTEGENARTSTLSNFIVKANAGFTNTYGVFSGSPDVQINNGSVRSSWRGVDINGNSVGTADRNQLSNITSIDCDTGFFINATGVKLTSVTPVTCGIGFRNQGVGTKFIGCVPVDCTTPFSTSTAASASEIRIGSNSSMELVHTEFTAQNRILLEPKGEVSNIEVVLQSKGTSRAVISSGDGYRKLQADNNGIGFLGAAPSGRATLGAAATDLSSTTTLANQIRVALIQKGLAE